MEVRHLLDDVYGYREGCVLVIYVKLTLKFKQSCNKSTGNLPLKGFVSLAKSRIHRSVCSSSSSVSIAIKGMPACGVPAGWSSDRASLHVGGEGLTVVELSERSQVHTSSNNCM